MLFLKLLPTLSFVGKLSSTPVDFLKPSDQSHVYLNCLIYFKVANEL